MPDVVDMDDLPAPSSSAENHDVAEHEAPKVEPAQAEPTEKEPVEARAESSPATGEKDEKFDPLKVVRDVVDKNRKEQSAASPAETSEKDPKAEPPKLDDENYTDVPFHKHPRFQQVLREKKTYQVDAQRYQNVQAYLEQNGLAPNEAADGLMIMGLAKTDPVKCWEMLRPFAEKVALAAGIMLPGDLQAEVEKGQLTPETALRIAREQAQRQAVEGRTVFERQRDETRRAQEHVASLSSAADDWSADRGRKDPNFEAKLPAIQKEILWLHRTEGKANTPAGVREQCEKAYKAVNAALPTPVRQNGARPVTPVRGGQVSGSAPRTAPKSTVDLIHQTLDDSRRAASA